MRGFIEFQDEGHTKMPTVINPDVIEMFSPQIITNSFGQDVYGVCIQTKYGCYLAAGDYEEFKNKITHAQMERIYGNYDYKSNI